MLSILTVPILLGFVLSLLFLLTFGLWRLSLTKLREGSDDRRNDILLWLLMLAAFALGIFVTYVFVV